MNRPDAPRRAPQYFPKLVSEFPDMPLGSLPEIPVGWVDMSWHNDVSPSFLAYTRPDAAYIRVWIDYPDEADRELLNGKRFTASWYDAEANILGDGCPFIETDDWATMLTAVIDEVRKWPSMPTVDVTSENREGSKAQRTSRPTEAELRAVIEQMTQALGIAKTTLETVIESNSRNLAAKSSIRFIHAALEAGAAVTRGDETQN